MYTPVARWKFSLAARKGTAGGQVKVLALV